MAACRESRRPVASWGESRRGRGAASVAEDRATPAAPPGDPARHQARPGFSRGSGSGISPYTVELRGDDGAPITLTSLVWCQTWGRIIIDSSEMLSCCRASLDVGN